MNTSQYTGTIAGNAELVKSKDTPRVHSAQAVQDDIVENLFKTASELNNRLNPVMRQLPCDKGGDTCPQPQQKPNSVADRIEQNNQSLKGIQAALYDIISRLEV